MKKDSAIIFFGFILVLLIVFSSLVLFYLNQKKYKKVDTAIIQPEMVSVSNTPDPVREIKKEKITILNATNKKGVAKYYSDKLAKLGYEKIETGNNDFYSEESFLYSPVDIKEDLKKIELLNYQYVETKNGVGDIRIIIGNEQ